MAELFRASPVGTFVRWLLNPKALQYQEDRDGAFAESYYLARKTLSGTSRAGKAQSVRGSQDPSTESVPDTDRYGDDSNGDGKDAYLVTFSGLYDPEVSTAILICGRLLTNLPEPTELVAHEENIRNFRDLLAHHIDIYGGLFVVVKRRWRRGNA